MRRFGSEVIISGRALYSGGRALTQVVFKNAVQGLEASSEHRSYKVVIWFILCPEIAAPRQRPSRPQPRRLYPMLARI